MGVSLDGFIAGPGGEIDWAAPDEELHSFHNEQARELGGELYGRRLWETMRPWETVDDDQSRPEHERELRIKAQLGAELPFEEDIGRWFPLWDVPL